MGEPEEVILEGAHLATSWAAALWRRRRADRPGAELADVRHRLELYVAAICPGAPPVAVAEPPWMPGPLQRRLHGIPAHLAASDALASTDGTRIRLPRELDGGEALDRYRLLALEQAARATRGTPDHLPEERAVRDLYLLSEAVAIDRWIATEVPGLRGLLVQERRRERASRKEIRRLTAAERILEGWLRRVLEADPEVGPVAFAARPSDSLAWAWERRPAPERGYRGVPAVPLWGRVDPRPVPPPEGAPGAEELPTSQRTRTLARRPRVRDAAADEDDERPGLCMVPTQDRQEKAEDPMGLSRPADRGDDADADDLADALSELPEARLVRSGRPAREILASEDPPEAARVGSAAGAFRTGIRYPEWDYRRDGYRPDHVTVWIAPPARSSTAQGAALALRNAALVRDVRRRFERLKPRRVRRGRQTDGSEVDLDAFVRSLADRLAGGPVEDRLYEVHRPLRRGLAVSILVDVSASTDGWVSERRRVIDVERDALLVVAEALDALGDRYAILAFSGQGPHGVSVSPLKDYPDRYGALARERIAALEPGRFTRLGAAVRHATAGLAREAVGHRLLLVLSDGKPNDIDAYEGRYGVEDARQAVAEARLQHIHPFCLTVDRQAPEYLPRMFGRAGFAKLRAAALLPGVLADVIRRLVG